MNTLWLADAGIAGASGKGGLWVFTLSGGTYGTPTRVYTALGVIGLTGQVEADMIFWIYFTDATATANSLWRMNSNTYAVTEIFTAAANTQLRGVTRLPKNFESPSPTPSSTQSFTSSETVTASPTAHLRNAKHITHTFSGSQLIHLSHTVSYTNFVHYSDTLTDH